MSSLILQGLALENFKGFSGEHSFRLARQAGLYYITGANKLAPELGANGVGKSTLFDALFWVLFNKTIRDARPANAIIPWDYEKGACSVALTFSRFSRTYTLTRSRKPNALTLARKDEIRDIDQDKIEQLLGMSEETFRRTIILGQFGTLFLDLKPEQQAQMFTEALDLNLWLRAADLSSQKRRASEKDMSTTQQLISAHEGRLAEIETSIESEQSSLDGYERQKAKQTAEIKETIDSYVSDIKDILKRLPKDIVPERLRRSYSGGDLSAIFPPLKAQIADARRALTALGRDKADLKAHVRSLENKLSEQIERAAQYKKALDTNKACPECGQKTSTTHLKDKLDAAKHNASTCQKSIDESNALVREHDDELDNGEEAVSKLETAQRYLDRLNAQLNDAQGKLVLLDQRNPHSSSLDNLKKRRGQTKDDLASARELLDEIESLIKTYELWTAAFKEIRLDIIDDTLRELEMAVTRHIEALGLIDWRIQFETERVTQSGSVSIAFTILLFPPDRDDAIKFESYSGGESQRLQLAVAFGLSEVLLERAGISPNIEVLDEPTKGLSKEGVSDLLDHLSERAKELGRALYFVDHHSLDRGAFDAVITIVKDEHGSHIQ